MSHLKYPEFVQIQARYECGLSQTEIAEIVWVSQPSVSRVITRLKHGYTPKDLAQNRLIKRAQTNQQVHQRIDPWGKLENYILNRIIDDQDSPDEIAGRWKLERWEQLSKDTIYKYLYTHHPSLIKLHFRRRWKPYRNRKQEAIHEKYQLCERRMIDDRPAHIENRKQIGHWEWDTIIGKRWAWKQVIATNVERKSWYLLSRICENKWAEVMYHQTIDMFADIPSNKMKTNTYDNGREFALHKRIEWRTKMIIYFAHTYCSWERWTNENTNSLIRQYYRKWTSFSSITDEDLQATVIKLNWRPRKRLWYRTPEEVFWWRRKVLT